MLWPLPVPVRLPLSLMVRPRSERDAWSAGINPNRMPVASDTPMVKASTRQSRPTTPPFSPTRGRLAVLMASSARMPTTPRIKPQAAANRREQHAFGQQLRDDAAAGGADGRSNRDLAAAPGGADQQQVGDVGAGDQQDEPDRAEQHVEGRADVGDHLLAEAANVERLVLVEHAPVLLLVLLGRHLQPGGGLGDRHAGLQLAGDVEVVALVVGVEIELEGHPHVGVGAELADVERLPDDADDGVGLAAQRDGAAQHVRIVSESPLPQALADQRHFGSVRRVFGGVEATAADDRHAEEREVVGRHLAGLELLWHAAAGKVHDVVAIGGDLLDDGGLRPPVGELGR